MLQSVANFFKTDLTGSPKHQLPIIKCEELVTSIKVNPIDDPDHAWDTLKNTVNKEPIETLHLDTPIYENKVII